MRTRGYHPGPQPPTANLIRTASFSEPGLSFANDRIEYVRLADAHGADRRHAFGDGPLNGAITDPVG